MVFQIEITHCFKAIAEDTIEFMLTVNSLPHSIIIHRYNHQPIIPLLKLDHPPSDSLQYLKHYYYYNPIISAVNLHWASLKKYKNQNPFILINLYQIDYENRSYRYLRSYQNRKNLINLIHQNYSKDQYHATILIPSQIFFYAFYQMASQC